MKRQVVNYSSGSKFIHWFVALIVICMLAGSFFLGDLPEHYQPSAYMLHKSFGLTILFLMIIRLFWIAYRGKPALPASVPAWQKFLAHSVQYSLYFFVILMPLSGWIMSVAANRIPSYFTLFKVPFPGVVPNEAVAELMEQVHNTIAWIIIVLLVIHTAGAIKHHFIDKDDVLRRMLPGRRR
ncbi:MULTISPECIES: cytochrome b [unclassified Legionella]|uniref:cytochrome b n=1 Tax=unclassified Legionella TaxID=2622702 RepID=UPI001E28D74E|nr:cytochrome b [Legionella sp. 31fI33]